MIASGNLEIKSAYPDRQRFRYFFFMKGCGLKFKSRLVWSVLVYASRKSNGYNFKQIAERTGLDQHTVSKLVAGELKPWTVSKNGRVYAIPPPDGAVRVTAETASWQDGLGSIPLLLPAGKQVKPVECVILAILASGKKRQVDLIRMLAVDAKTVRSALRNLIGLGLITDESDEFEVCVPTPEQVSWFRPAKKKPDPTYNPALPNCKLLLDQGYSERTIVSAVKLGWLNWPETSSWTFVRACVAQHAKNRFKFPNLATSERLFLSRLKKSFTKKKKPKAWKPPPGQRSGP